MPKKFLFYYFPPILWAIVIFVLSSIPGTGYPPEVFDYSYLAHFVEFFILTILVMRALGKSGKNIFLCLIICSSYALSDELHQIFITDRSMSLLDWLIDFLSIIIGIKFWMWMDKG